MTPKQAATSIHAVSEAIHKIIIGQEDLVNDVLIAFFSWGHVLLEWAPGLAKTKTIKTLAQAIWVSFSRIQFTPDLLPSDLVGSEVYRQQTGKFEVRKWPLFAHCVLADEINRAPSKVQSALLEAMEERQVTIWEKTFPLDDPFIVLATQNPIEQEGTYPLSEAQTDRFALKVLVPYPTKEQEVRIMQQMSAGEFLGLENVIDHKKLKDIIAAITTVHVDPKIYEYVADITHMSRDASLASLIVHGASPRASITFIRCAKVRAVMQDRDFVIPEDIKALAHPVLRHRILRSFEAIGDEISTDDIIDTILSKVRVP